MKIDAEHCVIDFTQPSATSDLCFPSFNLTMVQGMGYKLPYTLHLTPG
jgi:hypothetical protein